VAREKYSGGSTNPEKQYSMKGKPRNPWNIHVPEIAARTTLFMQYS
jgi:hypothetical protein